jgi:acetolactate synthase-1/2/3 large subunit
MVMNVADYIIDFLVKKNIKYAFEVPGGGAMFLNDAVAKNQNISSVFCHHEQSCAMASVGYSMLSNDVSLTIVTSGCGGTNAITGLLNAWQDSNRVIFLSGQSNLDTTTNYHSEWNLRKLGVQEVNIIEIVKSITKYATMIKNANDVKQIMEEAWIACVSGRPGPVWIDVPLDIQSTNINIDELNYEYESNNKSHINENDDYISVLQDINIANRPIIIAGNGVYLADAKIELRKFINKYQIPITSTFGGVGLISDDNPLYLGTIGIKGTRAANFAIQNSDLILVLGSSLNVTMVGYDPKLFGREAKIIAIDIDPIEHQKDVVKVDKIVIDDIFTFLYKCNNFYNQNNNHRLWINKCIEWKEKWQVFDREDIDKLNLYSFSKSLGETLKKINTPVVIADAGISNYVLGQTLKNSRLLLPLSQGEMGFALPASIGAYFTKVADNVIVVVGDGSIQFNIQELQTIKQYNLPIKIFVINNGGYLSIRQTQKKYFNERYDGVDKESGISFPSFEKIAYAYDIKYKLIDKSSDLNYLEDILLYDECIICEIITPPYEEVYPTVASAKTSSGVLISQPLENMAPFLTPEEFNNEMIIKPV